MSDPPLKKQREKCYIARDAHFKCLDDNDQDLYKCKATLEKYEADCPKIWLKHFEKTRDKLLLEEIKKRQTATKKL